MSATPWLALPGFAEAVQAIISEGRPANDRWLDSEEAADYLGVSRQRIHNLVSQGSLPRHGAKGYGLRFRRADLDAYAEGRR
jgi:excisionase family DNA binding protein